MISPANKLDPAITELNTNITELDLVNNFSFNMDSQIPFFCGDSEECRTFGSAAAIDTAFGNIEKKFAVVGTLEEIDKLLVVVECKLPKYFRVGCYQTVW